MALTSNSICLAFIRDKYENIFIPHLLSSQPGQIQRQICLIFVLKPNMIKCIISSSVRKRVIPQ